MDEGEVPEAGLFPQSVGERLRILRESAKLDLTDIATRTRIPLRHLEAIERADYAALPSQTYALGFTRSYARAVGADEGAMIADLRDELGRDDPALHGHQPYEPADPSRVPSRLLAWTAAALALLLAIGYGVWRTQYYGSDTVTSEQPAVEAVPAPDVAPVAQNAATPAAVAPAPTTGEVVLTATAPVWVKIYDGSKARLLQKEMAAGESYKVPANAVNPQILTGRPDALKVTVGGREVAPLGPPEKTIKDVGISAAALAARPPVPAVAAQVTPPPASSAPALSVPPTR